MYSCLLKSDCMQLALPWKKHWFQFDGDFTLCDGRAIYLPKSSACEETDSFGSTGNCVWDGAVEMAMWIDNHKELFHDKSVLELGAGKAGLAGVAAAMIGASKVALTDLGYCVESLDSVIRLNNIDHIASAEVLDWFEPSSSYMHDIIIGSDVVWLPDLVNPLVNTVAGLAQSSDVYIAHQTRSYATDLLFFQGMQDNGFICNKVFSSHLADIYSFKHDSND